MNVDHEIALMYASNPWDLLHPRTNFHSPFSNVILRVIRAPRPSLEDLILQLFAPDDVATQPVAAEDEPFAQAENDASASATDSTPGFDLSERIAREMQEQEDREQEMRDRATALRNQFGEFISSMFGNSQSEIGSVAPMFHQERVNAEAGPSMAKKPSPTLSGLSSTSRNFYHARVMPDARSMAEEDELMLDDSDKKLGKRRAQTSEFDPTNQSPAELLDSLEAALRHRVSQFDFPEYLEFQAPNNRQDSSTGHAPILLHTSNNAAVHAFENALLELQANLDLVAGDQDEFITGRRSQLDGRVRRELEDLDRRVLEAWAAKRRYFPSSSERV